MDKNFSYKDILFRLGYFRNKKNLSAREVSLQLGYSDAFINRIERNAVELKVSTLLEFMELMGITPVEFFYNKPESFEKDKELFEIISGLTLENKQLVLELARKLK